MTQCIAQGLGQFISLLQIYAENLHRVKDWLHGVCQSAPERVSRESLSSMPLTEAERLRIVHLLITNPCNEGGAGITPEEGEWQSVDAIFPLHDHNFNKKWLIHWSTRYSLTIDELTKIRDHFGEKASFSFNPRTLVVLKC